MTDATERAMEAARAEFEKWAVGQDGIFTGPAVWDWSEPDEPSVSVMGGKYQHSAMREWMAWRAALSTLASRPVEAAAVAWAIFDRHDRIWKSSEIQGSMLSECRSLNEREDTSHYRACGPYRVVPLYASPPVAKGVADALRDVEALIDECRPHDDPLRRAMLRLRVALGEE